MLSRSGPKNEIEQSPTISIDENTSHLEIAKILFEKNTQLLSLKMRIQNGQELSQFMTLHSILVYKMML